MLWTGFVGVKLFFLLPICHGLFNIHEHAKVQGVLDAQNSPREDELAMYGIFQNKTKI